MSKEETMQQKNDWYKHRTKQQLVLSGVIVAIIVANAVVFFKQLIKEH